MLGGFAAMGGHIAVIWQPWEYVIICGAALGTFVIANSPKVIKDAGVGLWEAFAGSAPKNQEYLDLLGLLFTVMREIKGKPRAEVEEHIENPAQSAIFR